LLAWCSSCSFLFYSILLEFLCTSSHEIHGLPINSLCIFILFVPLRLCRFGSFKRIRL
jgi:hypothetical protein